MCSGKTVLLQNFLVGIYKENKEFFKENKMRGSKIITTTIFILMLTVVMGLRNAEAQTPLACDAIPFTNGWISMTVSNNTAVPNLDGDTVEDLSVIYNAGLLGTVENSNGSVRAGLDWLYDDRQPNLETNMVGTQLVSLVDEKRRQKHNSSGNNTNPETAVGNIDLQSGGDSVGSVLGAVTVHVQILGEDCIELRNFCDTYTPLDTVVYDFSNMVSNAGQTINIGNLAEREGIVVITPVETCAIAAPPTFNAVSWNYMQGSVRIIDESGDYEYGTNVRARTAAPGDPYQS